MDQDSGNTTDKRNWRERLGIGKAAGAEMPKLSDDFKAVPEPAKAAAPASPAVGAVKPGTARPAPHVGAKPAPMAPRPAARAPTEGTAAAAPKPAAPKPIVVPPPAAPRSAPVAPDALASKLKDQREAAERLAIQRVQAAKQRAEAQVAASPAAPKPKFTFADENRQEGVGPVPAVGSAPVGQPRPAQQPAAPAPRPAAAPASFAPQAQPPSQFAPQMQPPRPQLGGNTNYAAPAGYQQAPTGYSPQQPYPPQYQPGFGASAFGQQPPQYRPIDPATGYVPPAGFSGGARPGLSQPLGPTSPRLGTANQRPSASSGPRMPVARGPQLPMSAPGPTGADGDDVFEAPQPRAPRRVTANEYQRAYQDEMGYEDELPRSRGLGMILGLLLLGLLVAIGVIYGYSHFVKSSKTAATGSNVPVVAAPAGATKVTPDTNAQGAEQASKKIIYDRIEGDHEIPGSPMKSNEEVPTPPAGSESSQPAQQNGAAQPDASGAGGVPLPLPPPPGSGTGQQGALTPENKTEMAQINPAAEPASAANSSAPVHAAAPVAAADAAATPLPAPPVPSAPVGAAPATPSPVAAAASEPAPAKEEVTTSAQNEPSPPPAKLTLPKPSASTPNKASSEPPRKSSANGGVPSNLGAKPVVLVPPSASAAKLAAQSPAASPAPPATAAQSSGGGLYGDAPVVASPAPQSRVALAKPPAAPAAPAVQPATGAYVVQLSSHNSRAEAQAEYARLSARHGAIVGRYAPIIVAGNIAGSTRYQLALGPMASNEVASGVCASLISAGERDCKVGRQ